MARLTQEETDRLFARILQELDTTPYACSSLARLSKGTTNFVFRGTLVKPLQDGTATVTGDSVIIKHSAEFVAGNRDFLLDISRCIFEEYMLHAMHSFVPTMTEHVSVKTPHLYLFNRNMNIQVIEDFQDTLDMENMLSSLARNKTSAESIIKSIGRALGRWLHSFHVWAAAPEQDNLRREVWKNEPMRKLKRKITYDGFMSAVEAFPEVLEAHGTTLEEVRKMAAGDFERQASDEGGEEWGIVHGDFWTGNVLLPQDSAPNTQHQEAINLFVVDWEFTQFGHRSYDLGQMIGDLYECKHFANLENTIWAIEGFVDGYGVLSEEMAFRTAIHTGVHLLCWYIRRDPKTPPRGTPEQIRGAVKIGVDFIVKAWERDRAWFEQSALASLFKKE